ncbi:MAG: sigma-70 family RNA polymerase sigma factor [Planctomycetes bacterium]|nr:sigma-70 family RNA polymerase sigma factor [Planctomycetota bacterium]
MESQDDLQRFRPFLRALAEEQLYSGLRQKIDPSDLVQQTMLQAIESQSQFRGTTDAAKASWLRAILKNVMAGIGRHFHRDRRDVSREQGMGSGGSDPSEFGFEIAGNFSSPSHLLRQSEDRQQIEKLMSHLTHEQQQALVMRYWHDFSLEEISQKMNKSPDAVAGLLYRGMKVLREKFD